VAVPLVVCALERAERVALAMEARHYRVRPVARLPRAWGHELAGLALAGASLLWRA
jgi:energy-coupling factor transporter transmembrane protein EcfT